MPRGEGGGAGECTADAEINPPPHPLPQTKNEPRDVKAAPHQA